MFRRSSMAEGFQEGQRIVVEQLIEVEDKALVPPGLYVVSEITHDLIGKARVHIRSVPDEDIQAEVDLQTLLESVREE
jgi:hypothetical protein